MTHIIRIKNIYKLVTNGGKFYTSGGNFLKDNPTCTENDVMPFSCKH